MITTPIADFAREYAEDGIKRFHMPGHKGKSLLGFEKFDLTEVSGADSLFEADGIIAESEANASRLFGCPTFYSTEGSSLAIRAMLFLAVSGKQGRQKILAGRNAHKVFMNTAALLDFDIAWLYPEDGSYHSCVITPECAEEAILREKPAALYITSPDYLGNISDIRGLSEVCHRYGVLLIVDNAHGAYLRFLPQSLHPMDLGADMCCDSAHKTLPVLTGGAYLHVREEFSARAKKALSLFASTSPSYLILESLDVCNRELELLEGRLMSFIPKCDGIRKRLERRGYAFTGDEKTKLTFEAKKYGYTGNELAGLLESKGLITEFYDPDFMVLMLSPYNSDEELCELERALADIPRRAEINEKPPLAKKAEAVMTPREAVFSATEEVSARSACGRTLAFANVSCPPAIPIVMCGERIDENSLKSFEYYGIETLCVVKRA